ncbi:MAG: nitronate monooxygenase [Bacteroidetes bacterium]|nr:nitronate monooxygenase [Bacteroidota bacterium]
MESLQIGDLHIKLPIIQGGMGVAISLSGLASAVANEGGVGVISSVAIGMLELDYAKNFRMANQSSLRREIRKAKSLTDGVLGVNLMIAITDYEDMLRIALEEKIDIVFIGAGLLLKKPSTIPDSLLESSKTKFVPKVSSAKAARIIFQHWANKYNHVPDAVVVEGPLAGGHLGFKKDDLENQKFNLSNLISETVSEMVPFEQRFGIEIPVIAAGGIYNGEDMYKIMQLGAKAVKIGTRFVTTYECDASMEYKESYIKCRKEDITIIDSPVGLPGRVIINDFVKKIQNGYTKPVKCPWKCLKTCNYKEVQYCIAEALFNSARGKMSEGFSFAGTNAYLATKIQTVKETIDDLILEYTSTKYKFGCIKETSES